MLPLLAFVLVGQAPLGPDEVPFRTIAFGSNGAIKDGGPIVMRDQKAFDVYRKLFGTLTGKQPTIDWSKEQLVALHTVGDLYFPASLQATRVTKKQGGGLEVNAALGRGDRPATPTPGVTPVLRRFGLYTLIAVPRTEGPVSLRIGDQPASSSDKPGKSLPR